MPQRLIPIGILSLICSACEPIEINLVLDDTVELSPTDSEDTELIDDPLSEHSEQNETVSDSDPDEPQPQDEWEPIEVPPSDLDCSDRELWQGNITISTQAELDSLTLEYGGVTGNLRLESEDIVSLEQLRCFTQIEHLYIDGVSAPTLLLDETEQLSSLNVSNSSIQSINIPNVEIIQSAQIYDNLHLQEFVLLNTVDANGNIHFIDNPSINKINLYSLQESSNIRIENNSSLIHFQAPWLQRGNGNIHFILNDSLEQISFPMLSTIGSRLRIEDNTNLQSASFPMLESTGGNLRIRENRQLSELDLYSLVYVGDPISSHSAQASLYVTQTQLSSLYLPNLVSIGCYMDIIENEILETIEMSSLIRVGNNVNIMSNRTLTDITSLFSLEEITGHINVSFNPYLYSSQADRLIWNELGEDNITGNIQSSGNRSWEEGIPSTCSGEYLNFSNGLVFLEGDEKLIYETQVDTCPQDIQLMDGSTWSLQGNCLCE